MKIILTNDDGIHAAGIQALLECLPQDVRPLIVAPLKEKSASSHSISLGQKLYVHEHLEQGIRKYAVDGTPADCIKFAVSELRDFKPDLIISGINQGANTGVSVYYSGTISAAREGFINRIPAVAISLCDKRFRDFSASQAVAVKLIDGYRQKLIPPHVLLNVNVPPLLESEIRGMRMTKQADSRFIEEFVCVEASDGKRTYTLAGEIELLDPDGTSDEEAVAEGFVSITPLKLDLTDHDALKLFSAWLGQ